MASGVSRIDPILCRTISGARLMQALTLDLGRAWEDSLSPSIEIDPVKVAAIMLGTPDPAIVMEVMGTVVMGTEVMVREVMVREVMVMRSSQTMDVHIPTIHLFLRNPIHLARAFFTRFHLTQTDIIRTTRRGRD